MLVLSPHFKKAYKKFVTKFPQYQEQIDSAIQLLEINIFDSKLRTHKLSGNLLGCYACSCCFNCRIVFTIEEYKNEKVVLLVTIGSHEEVY